MSFVLRLNDNYSDLRGQIMRMKPCPTLDMAYSMVLMEEQQTTPKSNNTALATVQTWKGESGNKGKGTTEGPKKE